MSETVLIFVYIVWIFSEIYLNRMLRSGSSDKKNQDKNSLKMIWIVIAICITVAVLISKNVSLPIYHTIMGNYVGVFILIFGILLRYFAVFSLGRFFTVDVTIRNDHKLKTNGMYKYVRHPSYAASLLSFIGMGIILNNWFSLAIICVSILSVFIYRIKIEEEALTAHFGSEYQSYKNQTARIIPFIF
ncbi:protein-S-isoprenylcysteine O-methyltransferase Ste14 [Pedobacter sp. UYEF25]